MNPLAAKVGRGLVRVLVSGSGSTARYKEVDGPDGSRFAAYRNLRIKRLAERFGYEVGKTFADGNKPMDADTRRRLRNARKRERQIARAR